MSYKGVGYGKCYYYVLMSEIICTYDMFISPIYNYTLTLHTSLGNIVAKVANNVQSKIRLNSKVTGINFKRDDYQMVAYIDENGTTKAVKANTTLVTVSLGVLKNRSISFVPDLPQDKENVIDNMVSDLMRLSLYDAHTIFSNFIYVISKGIWILREVNNDLE